MGFVVVNKEAICKSGMLNVRLIDDLDVQNPIVPSWIFASFNLNSDIDKLSSLRRDVRLDLLRSQHRGQDDAEYLSVNIKSLEGF